ARWRAKRRNVGAADTLKSATNVHRLAAPRHSALRTTGREDSVYQRCLALASLHLMKSLAVGRAVAHVNPPAAVPQITGADTQSEFSVALGASFHSSFLFWPSGIVRARYGSHPFAHWSSAEK